MAISAAEVKKLRETTGLGMMVCKKALTESDGDMEKAIVNLRKQGQTTAAKRAGKAAKEGRVSVVVQGLDALVYEVNSETDFVARSEDFSDFVNNLAAVLLKHKPASLETAKNLPSDEFGGQTIESKTIELIGKIGENISLRRFRILCVADHTQRIFSYVHGNGKIGVLAIVSADKPEALDSDAVNRLGKDMAMQVAASNPIAINRESIPADTVAKEREIYFTQAQSSGKPEKIWDKIVEGKLNKFYKEVSLLEQPFIRDTNISVRDRMAQAEKETGAALSITQFVRYELGAEE